MEENSALIEDIFSDGEVKEMPISEAVEDGILPVLDAIPLPPKP